MPSRFRRVGPRFGTVRQPASDGGRGGGIDIGKAISGLGKAFSGAIAQQKQDAVANQLLNSLPGAGGAPRAQWVGGEAPEAGVPTYGTAPASGGEAELDTRIKAARLADELQQQQNRSQLAEIRARGALGGGRAGRVLGSGDAGAWTAQGNAGDGGQGSGSGWGARGGKGQKQPKYEPGSGDIENDESTDDFGQIRADFDDAYGKGAYNKYAANFSSLKPDDQGNYTLTDKSGNPEFSVPGADAPMWLNRTNAARVKRGMAPVGPKPSGSNPSSTAPAGSAENPFQPSSNLELRALPYDSYLIDPSTGQTVRKRRPSAAGAVTQ